MGQPTPGDLHVSAPLTNLSIAYTQEETVFIADRVFPTVPVANKYGSYYRYAKGNWFRAEAKVRAPGTETVGSGWNVDRDTYAAEVFGIHKDISDQDLPDVDEVFDLDADATRFVTWQNLLTRELAWAQKYFATGVWGTDLTGVAGAPAAGQFQQWDQAGSTPIQDIKDQSIAMAALTGRKPNTLVLGPHAYQALTEHPEIIERIKYSERGVVGSDLIATLFGVPNILVAEAIQNTAPEGTADQMSYVFGKAALLAYAAPNPGRSMPSAGYTFSWTGYLGATAMGSRIKRFRMEEIASTRIEGEMAFEQKVVAPEMGVFYNAAVA